jgi:hypothetical protein
VVGGTIDVVPKKLLAMVKPPKPVNEMSDDEREAFAAELYRMTVAGLKDDKHGDGGD